MVSHNDVVIGKESVTRACGHEAILIHYQDDPFRAARREKLQKKRCHECGRKASDEHNVQQQSKTVRKGSEMKALPTGTTLLLALQTDGWHGSLKLPDDGLVDADAPGLMGLISKLSRKALAAQGVKVQGKVK